MTFITSLSLRGLWGFFTVTPRQQRVLFVSGDLQHETSVTQASLWFLFVSFLWLFLQLIFLEICCVDKHWGWNSTHTHTQIQTIQLMCGHVEDLLWHCDVGSLQPLYLTSAFFFSSFSFLPQRSYCSLLTSGRSLCSASLSQRWTQKVKDTSGCRFLFYFLVISLLCLGWFKDLLLMKGLYCQGCPGVQSFPVSME